VDQGPRGAYLSDPEKAHLWDSTIGGGPGPLPTLLLIARGAKSGKLRPLPLPYDYRRAGSRQIPVVVLEPIGRA
jgi:hypothetical protein